MFLTMGKEGPKIGIFYLQKGEIKQDDFYL